jgi:hypothetical protein
MAAKGSTYRLRERSITYNRYYNEWEVGRQYRFAYPQLADVFVHVWKNYGPKAAQDVIENLKTKLDMTIARYVKNAVTSEAKGAVTDFLLGLGGAPGLPGPAGLAVKVLEAAGVVLGDAYLKTKIEMNKANRNYTCDFSPASDTDLYCDFVLYSWIIDPVNGPYYTTYVPGTMRAASH